MASHADTSTLRQALQDYFEANDFGADGGYEDRWVKFKVGPIPIVFPNFAARRRAVPMHDLNHIVTGYETDLVGEGEISAFEIAAKLPQPAAISNAEISPSPTRPVP